MGFPLVDEDFSTHTSLQFTKLNRLSTNRYLIVGLHNLLPSKTLHQFGNLLLRNASLITSSEIIQSCLARSTHNL
jgi:hypothetical protein